MVRKVSESGLLWGMAEGSPCIGEGFRQVSANTRICGQGRVSAKVKGKGRTICHIIMLVPEEERNA